MASPRPAQFTGPSGRWPYTWRTRKGLYAHLADPERPGRSMCDRPIQPATRAFRARAFWCLQCEAAVAQRWPGSSLLTARRLQVLRLAANGKTNTAIASELCIAVDSVKTHLRFAYAALGARDRAHAVAIALALNLIRSRDIELPMSKRPKEPAA